MNVVYSAHNHENIFSRLIEEFFEKLGASHSLSEFFVHLLTDTLNIFLLLFLVMFFVSFLQTYINYDKLKKRLIELNDIWVYLLAVGLGVISPFCSCSIIPVLIGIVNLGIPTSVAVCFFTSASLLNIAAVVTMYASTGSEFTIIYILGSLAIVFFVSLLMSKININASVKSYSIDNCCEHEHSNKKYKRAYIALHNTMHVFKGAWIFILIGAAASSAALIFVPLEKIIEIMSSNYSVLLAAIIGLPIHSDVFTILPILILLKDVSTGVALSFALATMSISLPSAVLLSRAFKTKFIMIYITALFALSVFIGYIGIIFIP